MEQASHNITVSDIAYGESSKNHHVKDAPQFINPWKSFRWVWLTPSGRIISFEFPCRPQAQEWGDLKHVSTKNWLKSWFLPTYSPAEKFLSLLFPPKPPYNIEAELKWRSPTWGDAEDKLSVKATWLGWASMVSPTCISLILCSHACFLVELPAPNGGTRGPRILFDPALSPKCAPNQVVGPSRYTSEWKGLRWTSTNQWVEPPCKIEEIPAVDVIVISVSLGSSSVTFASDTPRTAQPLRSVSFMLTVVGTSNWQ